MDKKGTYRNKEIFGRYLSGDKVIELAKEYSITVQRVRQICEEEKHIHDLLKKDSLYIAIYNKADDLMLVTRTYNLLKRYGVNSIENVRNLSELDMKKMRNCGIVMQEFLKNI